MDAKAAAQFFVQDVDRLRGIAPNLGLRDIEVSGERSVTFLLGWRGRTLRIVMRASEDYPLSPTSLRFCAENDPADDRPQHWPQGVAGINAPERLICSPGFAEGHQRHSDWPVMPEKNRIHRLAQRLVYILGGADAIG